MGLSNTSNSQPLNPTVPTNNTVVPIPPETVPRLLPDVLFAPLSRNYAAVNHAESVANGVGQASRLSPASSHCVTGR